MVDRRPLSISRIDAPIRMNMVELMRKAMKSNTDWANSSVFRSILYRP